MGKLNDDLNNVRTLLGKHNELLGKQSQTLAGHDAQLTQHDAQLKDLAEGQAKAAAAAVLIQKRQRRISGEVATLERDGALQAENIAELERAKNLHAERFELEKEKVAKLERDGALQAEYIAELERAKNLHATVSIPQPNLRQHCDHSQCSRGHNPAMTPPRRPQFKHSVEAGLRAAETARVADLKARLCLTLPLMSRC